MRWLPCVLLFLRATLAAKAGGADELRGSEHGVTWLVQLSDLHLSTHYASREADLLRFAARLLSRLRPAAVLVSGDLTDAKTASRVGSAQYAEEWAAVSRSFDKLQHHAELPRSHLLAVRGNHDTFDVPVRGGNNDLFARTLGVGRRAAAVRVGGAVGVGGPAVALLALDASSSPGWRRPCNFAGAWGGGEAEEAGAALRAAGPSDAVLAFGHFPLSFVDGRERGESLLGAQLARLNASAYLCGHLHWRFGDRLHHWHAFGARRLLELEAGDWKQSRAWRLLALDEGAGAGGRGASVALSFRDQVFQPTKAAPLLVLITQPPDARHHAVTGGDTVAPPSPGSTAARSAPQAFVRALVFPPKGVPPAALAVDAIALCGTTEMARAPMRRAGNGSSLSDVVWQGPRVLGVAAGSPLPLEAFARRCAQGLTLRVEARCPLPGGAVSGLCGGGGAADSRPLLFSPPGSPPAPLGATRLARAMLSADGPRAARRLFWAALVMHAAAALALPVAAARSLRAPRWPLAAPFRALGRRPRLRAAHACYLAALAVGPWAATRPFSGGEDGGALGLLYGAGLGLLRAPAAATSGSYAHAYVSSMDATFVTTPQLLFVISGWVAVVGLALASADGAAASAAAVQPCAAGLRLGCAALLRSAARSPLRALAVAPLAAALLWISVTWAAQLAESYGLPALIFSPGVAWVGPLGCAALAAGLAGIEPPAKTRRE
jgi:hypothetical protein